MDESLTKDPNLEKLKRLRSCHLAYTAQLEHWNFCLAAYEGGDSFAKKEYLYKHARETQEDFDDRVKRVHYPNFCAPIVDYFTDFVYNESIQRRGGKDADFCTKFWADVNKREMDANTFMREISDESQIFGVEYVIVDAPPKSADQLTTKADEERKGIRPYWVKVRPHEILDWVRDEFGNYAYVKRQQVMTQMIGRARRNIEKYTEWYSDVILVTEVDVTDARKPQVGQTMELVNELKDIPIVPVRYKESKQADDTVISFLRDLSKHGQEVMNLTSLLQEFLYRQCFNMLAMEDEDTLQEGEKQEGVIGTANMLRHPKGSAVPTYVSPPVGPAQFLADERQWIINQMYRIAAQNMVNELYNGGAASGMSKMMSFSSTVPKIATRADTLERAETELMEFTLLFMGKKWSGSIKYKDHYEITNLTDSITHLTSLFRDLGMPSKTFAKTELKRLIHLIDGKFSEEELQKIEAEIDKALDSDPAFEKWLEQVANPKGASPAAQQKPKQQNTADVAAAESTKIPTATNALRKPQNK